MGVVSRTMGGNPVVDDGNGPVLMTNKGRNSNLHGAKRAKNDEFYTRLEDIEAEVRHYHDPVIPGMKPKRNPFRDKVVYLNCDDPQWSNFWVFFALKFDELEIKELISTHYEADGSSSYAMFLDRAADGTRNDYGTGERGIPKGRIESLEGNGDFRSEECVELLERSDVVVTNPPFSLFREYVAQLMEYEKKFLIIGSKNAITYKEIFPLIKDVKLWIGSMPMSQDLLFRVPDDRAGVLLEEARAGSKYRIVDGQVFARAAAVWFTNLDHKKRHEELELYRRYAKTPEDYPTYDNYDAIEVGRVKDIPCDYDGVMGVPITFLDKFNPDQFEIVGATESEGKGFSGGLWMPGTKAQAVVKGKPVYKRIFIRKK